MMGDLHREQSRGMQILLDRIDIENKTSKDRVIPKRGHLPKPFTLESADLRVQQRNARQQEILDRAERRRELQMRGMGNDTRTPSATTIFGDAFGPDNQNQWFDNFNAPQPPAPVPDALQPARAAVPDTTPGPGNIPNLNSGSADNAIINDNANAVTDRGNADAPANNAEGHRTDQTANLAPSPSANAPAGSTSQGDQGNAPNQGNGNLPPPPVDEDDEMDIISQNGDANDRASTIGGTTNWLLLLILLTNIISLFLGLDQMTLADKGD